MRNLCIVVIVLWMAICPSIGQNVAVAKTDTLSSAAHNHRYFLQADMQISQTLKSAAMYTTFSACWLFPKQYYIGILYQKLTSEEALNKFVPNTSKDDIILEHQNAGIKAGYIVFANKRLSFNPEASVNWAMVKYQYPVGAIYRYNFMVVEPSLNMLINLHKNLAAGIGLSYRINAGLRLNGLNSNDLNGFTGRLFIRYGKLK